MMRSQMCTIGKKIYEIYSDDNYLNHIGSEFEPHTVQVLETIVDNKMVVFDVGANIGCTSILFSNIAKAVYSFEPSPSTFEILKRNINKNNLTNVTAVQSGLGSSNFTTKITFAPSNRSGGFISNKTVSPAGHSVEDVEIITGDEFCSLNNPWRKGGRIKFDFIKIDVEGFELEVLEGLKKTIQMQKPAAYTEMNHWCLNAFQRISIPDFIDAILSIFPICFAIDGETYADIRDEHSRYHVMYNHIIHNKFNDLVCGFSEKQFDKFASTFRKI